MFRELHRTGITLNHFLLNIFNSVTNEIVRTIKYSSDPSSFTDCDTTGTRKFHLTEKKGGVRIMNSRPRVYRGR